MPVIAFIDGAIGMRPVRVLAQEGQQPVAIAPEHVEAIPLHVKRQMREQPSRAFADGIGIARDRTRPLRRPLIYRDGSHAIGDRRHELHRGGAGADHRHAFAVELDIVRPQRGVEHQAGKILLALEMSRRWIVELADRADQDRRLEILHALVGFQRRDPAASGLIPARRGQSGVEADVAANVMFERDLLEIVQQFFALREITGPVVARAERERVRMIGRIDAAAGIPVDVPGSAEFVVLLDNGVGDTEPAERDAERDGADPGADDQDVLLLQLLARRLLCPAHIGAMNPISSRISGAYSGVTFSPRQARIIFSISSLPGSVIAGLGSPFANKLRTAARISSWISLGTPASGSGISRTSRLGL